MAARHGKFCFERKWAGVLAAAALIGLGSPTASEAVTYEPAPPFCDEAVVHDYLRPFERMPRLNTPSPSGHLGFASWRLRLHPFPQLLVGGGDVGYWLRLANPGPAVDLGWEVTATLMRVDWQGRAVDLLKRTQRQLNTVSRRHGSSVRFPVDERPSAYRLTVVFRNESGRKLGGYGFYFRVMTPTEKARLALNADSYRPGNTVFGRIENYGTATVRYGAPYVIERFDGSIWMRVPESPRVFIMPLYGNGPGLAGRWCSPFYVSPGMPPGHYRMVKSVHFESPNFDPPRRRVNEIILSAEFQIVE